MIASGRDVDAVITTANWRHDHEAGIDFVNLSDENADKLVGFPRAATIFGATGGVMEAALRTAYELLSGETLQSQF